MDRGNASMRDAPLDDGHRAKVADTRTASKAEPPASTNFEYDDNEWDIGIGDLIIDLDADIEKTNEKVGGGGSGGGAGGGMSSAAGGKQAGGGKMAVEHSATVDKGLKMKIKRTKPGTKTSEAKHEIVKSGELNGGEVVDGIKSSNNKHPAATPVPVAPAVACVVNSAPVTAVNNASKRGSSGHRRDKVREKHSGGGGGVVGGGGVGGGVDKAVTKPPPPLTSVPVTAAPDVNGVARTPSGASVTTTTPAVANQTLLPAPTPVVPAPVGQPASRVLFPVTAGTGPGPPVPLTIPGNVPGPPLPPVPAQTPVTPLTTVLPATPQVAPPAPVPVAPVVVVTATVAKAESVTKIDGSPEEVDEPRAESPTPPPPKKSKTTTDPKDVSDVCVGTSVGTITEPDCLGPCEPGTSVTLEGIVWHETEGGVLVVNVTWRGKTYVGTLLDCTQHDWAPPRFCDSPTSDLDARVPKGRGKRGRAAAAAAASAASTNQAGDLSNFTETRSSVHSKLRNGGAKGRRGGTNGGSTSGTGSPTPFVPPRPEPSNKRKNRSPEEESTPGKKNRAATSTSTASGSPPVSPVLLECPEPNCSKKYKHINGLKYHQSHAHGSADDDDTKESMSDNEESNVEAASPAAAPVKSPEKVIERKEEPVPSPTTPTTPVESLPSLPVATKIAVPSSPVPATTPSIPPTLVPTAPPQAPLQPSPELPATLPIAFTPEVKNVVKPGVLQFGPPAEEFPAGLFSGPKQPPLAASASPAPRAVLIPPSQSQPLPLTQASPTVLQLPTQQVVIKPPQFKVKPTAALMPEEKKDRVKLSGHKKKSRKSPAGSPLPPDTVPFGMDQSGREDVQSPAYSDISDDAAPLLEAEAGDVKGKCSETDKKADVSPSPMSHYNMYPYYGQPPYLVPSVPQDGKAKEASNKLMDSKPSDKDKKDGMNVSEYQQQKLLQQHYYQYGYMPGYPYNLEPSYPLVLPPDEKSKDIKDEGSSSPADLGKGSSQLPSPIQIPNPLKAKGEPGNGSKDKHQNDNHQILKESIEMKNQMSPYGYSRQQQQQQQHQEDLRRYYLYPEQHRRKESQGPPELPPKSSAPLSKPTLSSPGHKHKDKSDEKKEQKEVKQEGVKPTMETQGPPPPPTSQYAYIHPSYMQSPHYGALPFDPGHPMYRSMNPMLVPGPYSGNPYLHHQLPRYHAPEDLSRSPSGPTKALDLLQHHASQYYSSHKIHELQERALKSPTPKTPTSNPSPSGPVGPSPGPPAGPGPQGPAPAPSGAPPLPGKPQPAADGKEGRSPPPQRHVHTHHHTHVGLGYPILASQYPAPYGGKPMVRP